MQYVSLDGGPSLKHEFQCGVPQGSVLWSILYTLPLSHNVKKFNFSYHIYADDSQLYLSFQPTLPGDRDLAMSTIKRWVHENDHWMLVNSLKLNKDKTELRVISAIHLPRPILQEISVVNETIRSSQKARNIGVILIIFFVVRNILHVSIYTLSDLGDSSKLIGSLSRTMTLYSPPSETKSLSWTGCFAKFQSKNF